MEALKAGAHGYALKGVGASELVDIVRTVASGGSFVSPTLAARLLQAMQNPDRGDRSSADPLAGLARREEQILELVATGLSNKEVARELDLQEKTIKHYMTSILQKLHVRNRVEAALLAREAGRGGRPSSGRRRAAIRTPSRAEKAMMTTISRPRHLVWRPSRPGRARPRRRLRDRRGPRRAGAGRLAAARRRDRDHRRGVDVRPRFRGDPRHRRRGPAAGAGIDWRRADPGRPEPQHRRPAERAGRCPATG